MELYQYDSIVRATMEGSPIPFLIFQFVDMHPHTLAVSKGFCEMFGIPDIDTAYKLMDNNDVYRLIHPDDAPLIADAFTRFGAGDEQYDIVYRTKAGFGDGYIVLHAQGKHFITKDGTRLEFVWFVNEGQFTPDAEGANGGLSHAFSRMILEGRTVAHRQYDTLTGLPNMTHFFELASAGISHMWLNGEKPAVLFFDLSGMKEFNNKWGFAEGDKLIRSLGHLLGKTFGKEYCSRFAQDHFAAFTNTDDLNARLEAFLAEADQMNDGKMLPVKVGIYLPDRNETEISRSCDRAKMAADIVRNTFVSTYHYFDDSMMEAAEKRQYIAENLDRAISEGWIQVYFQPIVRAINGKVCDEEALARWIDPVRGFIPPDVFISALEEARLVYKLDLHMLDLILEKLKRQKEDGLYLVPISVNLSRVDFDCCDIVEEIRQRVDAAGIERRMITIEITESVIGRDLEFMQEQVNRFHQLGFSVWMDDFGSQYSSLDVLQSIRFDLIKFDLHFMQQFDSGEKGKIILTELMKMAISLGVETVCEGVERADQLEFLKGIGCNKLQGYYYCKPIPYSVILERYRTGTQIGFENPKESTYYTQIGSINLYNMSVISTDDDDDALKRYYDTIPMAIIEVKGSMAKYVRYNMSYHEFMQRIFGMEPVEAEHDYSGMTGVASAFMSAVLQCSVDGNRVIVDERVSDQSTVHSFIRRVAVNPVSGASAVAVAVLAVMDGQEKSVMTYAGIAEALSADYINLYYVDLETEDFVEYSSDASTQALSVERHGKQFFSKAQEDAKSALFEADVEYFTEAFTKENMIKSLNEQGTFTLSYRLLIRGEPVYVNLKAVRMGDDNSHIIIGVNNVDLQMRQKETLEMINAERIIYNRVTALSGDYICFYSVNPETDEFIEYSATKMYEDLGLDKSGKDFFKTASRNSRAAIYKDDLDLIYKEFNKENILREIRENGLFSLNYRLMMGGEPTYVCLKAAIVEEQDGPQLIVGIINVDAQVRHEQEYERSLSAARSRANLDTLTGVKNKVAYDYASEALSKMTESGQQVEYAVSMCKLIGLKDITDSKKADQLVRDACRVVCVTFKHSPVFRVSPDEFAVISQNEDYAGIDSLVESLRASSRENHEHGGPVIACGTVRYDGVHCTGELFKEAYKIMLSEYDKLTKE